MITHKIFLVLLVLMVGSCSVIAQRPLISDFKQIAGVVTYKLDSGYLAEDLWIGFPRQLIKTTVVNKKRKQLAVEIQYLTNSSFSYTEYDTYGKIAQQGIYYSDSTTRRDTMFTLPNWRDDPDGSKGLLMDFVMGEGLTDVNKDGIWLERINYTNSFRSHFGFYRNGVKEGIWELSARMPLNNQTGKFIVDSLEQYDNGKRLSIMKSKSNGDDTTKLLRRSWYLTKNENDELSFTSFPFYPFETEALNFFSANFFHTSIYNSPLVLINGQWFCSSGMLTFVSKNKKLNFVIKQLDKSILQIKKIELPIER